MIAESSELVAGGTCGLVVLASPGTAHQWQPLLAEAERRGLSVLLTSDPTEASTLAGLGVHHVSIVADTMADEALALAGAGSCTSLVLLSPSVPASEPARAQVRRLRLPRLLLAGSAAGDDQRARSFDRISAGPVAMRFIPVAQSGVGLVGDPFRSAAEAICLFALHSAVPAPRRQPHPGLFAA